MARRSKGNHSQASTISANQSIFTSLDEHLDISMLATWLWMQRAQLEVLLLPLSSILPLVFLKRFSDVFNDELTAHVRIIETRLILGGSSKWTSLMA